MGLWMKCCGVVGNRLLEWRRLVLKLNLKDEPRPNAQQSTIHQELRRAKYNSGLKIIYRDHRFHHIKLQRWTETNMEILGLSEVRLQNNMICKIKLKFSEEVI
ncbi:hypothetical protein B566_EDAN013545 [Ephemera danica]|nr:hypothetical protein B566_EDAN013545 [Ephemera danica]